MTTYISILRGINVSGKNLIKMDALRTLMMELKFQNVQTYIQSGNIIFENKSTPTETLSKKISTAIEKQFGFSVPVLTLTVDELKQTISKNPFITDKKKDISCMHVTFLNELPSIELFNKIETEKYLPDEIRQINKSIYLYCPNGYGKTKLHNTFLENKLKVSATTRNWKTCNELINLSEKQNA